jgi:hypothetical protein
MGFARFGKATRVLRILRMIRLLRLARMKEVLEAFVEQLNSEYFLILVDVAKLLFCMLGVAHIIACAWYLVSTSSTPNWITVKEGDNPGLYIIANCDEDQKRLENGVSENACGKVDQLYIMALRWAMTQFAGGMDEVVPVHFAEHMFAALVNLLCFWGGAVFVSFLTSSMTNLYMMSSQKIVKLATLRRYLRSNQISKNLGLRVTRNAEHSLKEHAQAAPEEDVDLLNYVSQPLRIELHFEMYGPIMQIHPFFEKYMCECPHVMRRVCHTSMAYTGVSRGDVLFNVGEQPRHSQMIIIASGKMEYLFNASGENVTSVLTAGSWVCEACLWVSWVHRGQLVAKEYTKIFTLDSADFGSIACSFEHTGLFDPLQYATEFCEALEDCDEDEVSDLPLPHQLDDCHGIPQDDPCRSGGDYSGPKKKGLKWVG